MLGRRGSEIPETLPNGNSLGNQIYLDQPQVIARTGDDREQESSEFNKAVVSPVSYQDVHPNVICYVYQSSM